MNQLALAVVTAAVAGGLGAYLGQPLRRRHLAGPVLDQWRRTRRDLSPSDRLRVWWATTRRRPVGRPALAPAQLARVALAELAAERALRHDRLQLRVGMLAVVGLAVARPWASRPP